MDSNRIEELLQKYWNCETSLEEEKQLREYFQRTDVPEHLNETANLFRYFDQQKNTSIQDVALDGAVMRGHLISKTRNLIYNSLRIAAGVAVLVVAGWFIRHETETDDTAQVVVDTYDDPKLAFEETKKALRMISDGFEEAEQQAKKLNLFNEAQQDVKPKRTGIKKI